ncbi:hypothetical protein E1B28_012915 [Marasmius oreades]|uniref:Autophagy-related protein 14 n=1 Tax=Marasmius oreades TaxID=181124 RepID=A0A9P7URA8_9AGAR|nr:uncharacterized protein E1B28_012915 [Marasmius oreades]KAG7088969.1 hypothetical protein E1B28_012915 [Marasmius oreades]
MECQNCELRQRQFFCANCLRAHQRDLHLKTQHFAAERDEQFVKATKSLQWIEPNRTRRAEISDLQNRVDEAMGALSKLRKDNDKKRARLQTLRENLATRRRTLSAATLMITPNSSVQALVNRESQELSSLSANIARARSGLVQELVEVFNVVEVGGRPPVGGKAGTKGEWTIADLILPVPGDIRRYPPDHINAVITHTIHFLSLLTFYLGIKLPFEITWSGGKVGVGVPYIRAGPGGESGGWTKWHVKQPLHLSAKPQASPISLSASSSPNARLISDSYTLPDPEPQQTFTTAFAMLLYNVCYLSYTQSVDIPLAQAGDVLSNLWSVCCSAELGRHSHETQPYLPAPTPPSFQLDFAQLMQAMSTSRVKAPRKRAGFGGNGREVRPRGVPEVDEDGWDIVEDEGF